LLNIRSLGGKLKLAISRDTNRAVLKKKKFITFFLRNHFSSKGTTTVSAVKALKPFQSWATSPSCYPSPPRCMSLPSHDRMAFSGLIKARERPRTKGAENTKKWWREKR